MRSLAPIRAADVMLELFTIGHSTHSLDAFLELLTGHRIEALADIRRFPGSRKFPHFNRETLAEELERVGIEYIWIESLGGRRSKSKMASSVNAGLRNESFRNFADYMPTGEFREGVRQLLESAEQKRTAFMCSESVFWRCHRRLVSDYLLARGIPVQHIMPAGQLHPHTLTSGAVVIDGEVTYPSSEGDNTVRTLF
jgi:uncharacterized protein (DUF488 family)